MVMFFGNSRGQSRLLGKISEEEWAITACEFDSSAKALIIFDAAKCEIVQKDNMTDSDYASPGLKVQMFELGLNRHIRIKVLEDFPEDFNVFEYQLSDKKGEKQKISFLKGFVLSNQDGKIRKRKIKQKDINKKTSGKDMVKYSLCLCRIKKGDVIDLKLKIISRNFDVPEWSFMSAYPCLLSSFCFSRPDFFEYQKIFSGTYAVDNERFTSDEHYSMSYPTEYGWSFYLFEYERIHDCYNGQNLPSVGEREECLLQFQLGGFTGDMLNSSSGGFYRAH